MARYRRSFDRPGRVGRPVRVGRAVSGFLARKDTSGGMRLVRLWRAWDEIMGEMAAMARPLGHRGRKLILAAEDPMVMQEAQFLGPMILHRINEFLGQEVFDKVVFELLNGRIPLDEQKSPKPVTGSPKPQKPKDLGKISDKLDPDSPVGKCYRAYQRVFSDE